MQLMKFLALEPCIYCIFAAIFVPHLGEKYKACLKHSTACGALPLILQ